MPQDLIIFIISDVFVRVSVCLCPSLSLTHIYSQIHQPALPNIFLISIHIAIR
jgi:hypothetical protein